MKILVCVKSVPRGDVVPLDPQRGTLERTKVPQALNPSDCAALEQAFRLKERYGGTVTALSMGPPGVERLLREICILPVDETVFVTDPLYAGADTLATARVLAAAAKYLGGVDLVLLGNRAIDGETGHVGPELAALLGIGSCLTNITGECFLENGHVRCSRLLERSQVSLSVPLPAVLTVCGGGLVLRPPGIAGMRCAKPVRHLTNKELGLSADTTGLAGSPTRVVEIRPARDTSRSVRYIRDAETGAREILDILHAGAAPSRPVVDLHPAERNDSTFWVVSLADDPPSENAVPELVGAVLAMGAKVELVRLGGVDDVACATALATLAKEARPDGILLSATVRGRCVAPYCAALLRTGLTADCTELSLDAHGILQQTRPAFGGGVMARIVCREKPQMATVRPGVFPSVRHVPEHAAAVEVPHRERAPKLLGSQELGISGLHGARIVLAGGKGIGSKEGFMRLEALAGSISAVVGASRSAVDAGYASYMRQVGQTGTTVRPDLYIALAISGTVQHIAGMRDSGMVVAVNTDPKAPIFMHADIGIIASWEDVVDSMLRMTADGG